MHISKSPTTVPQIIKRKAEAESPNDLFDTRKSTKKAASTSPSQPSPTANPHKDLPPARAAQHSASSSQATVSGQQLRAERINERRALGMALIENIFQEKDSDTSQTEICSTTVIADDSDHDETPPPRQPHSPISGTPIYGTGAIMSPIANIHTPGGSSRLIFRNESQAHITQTVLGEGGDTSAYAATFTSPGQTRYPAAAVSTMQAAKTISSHPDEFGHLANIHIGDMDYVTLTLRGTTIEDAAKKIQDYDVPQQYQLAFLLKHFPTIVEKLALIEASGHAHEDVKPANLVIWGPEKAGPIDMRALPKIGDRKRTFSKDFTSPGKQMLRLASSSSDVFATGKSVSLGLAVFKDSFSEIPGLTTLLADTEKPRDIRPDLSTVKARLETCLQDFKAINPDEYDAQLAAIQENFFSQ